MLLTRDKIYNRIKTSKYCFWSLYLIKSLYDKPHIHTYRNEFEKTDIDINEQIDKSIKILDSILNEFPPEARLSIELKLTEKSNGTGKIGALDFVNNSETNDLKGTPGQNQNSQIDFSSMGYVPESIMNEKFELLRQKHDLDLEKRFQKMEANRELEKIKEFQNRLKEKYNNLKRLEIKYKSDQGKIAGALGMLGKKLLNDFIPVEGLGEVENKDISETEKVLDKKRDLIENFSTALYDNGLSAEQTNNLLLDIQSFIKNKYELDKK